MFPLDLTGRTALVTGSARGIGQAIAQQLAEAGAAVMLTDIDGAALEEAHATMPGRRAMIPGDITEPEFPQKLVDATLAEFGSLDIVVNNAGYTWDNVIQKMSDAQFQAMLDIHLVAPFRVLRAASGYLREAAKAEIAEGRRVMRKVVNITSISGTCGNAGQIGYAAGKAGINGMTLTLAKEWGRYNVCVNSVGYGFIETRLTQPLGSAGAAIEMKGHQIPVGVQPKAIEAMKSITPLGRLGSVEEAAGPVLFFCSPLSDYVTGEVLIVSGGGHF